MIIWITQATLASIPQTRAVRFCCPSAAAAYNHHQVRLAAWGPSPICRYAYVCLAIAKGLFMPGPVDYCPFCGTRIKIYDETNGAPVSRTRDYPKTEKFKFV